MIHPLLRLAATEPHLLADHFEAYAGLVSEEIDRGLAGLKQRAMLLAVAGVSGALGVLFGGIAVMLWAVVPIGEMRAPWALLAVPGIFILAAVGCVIGARQASSLNFDDLKKQLAADMSMLREVSAA